MIDHVTATSPIVRELNRLFQPVEHRVWAGDWKYARWKTTVTVHCRYFLVFYARMTWTDEGRCEASLREPFEFILSECGTIVSDEYGVRVRLPHEDLANFGIEQWNRLVAAGGDFSAIGVKGIRSEPMESCGVLFETCKE